MVNPSERFPDDMRQHLVAAIADYVGAFKACALSDGSDIGALLRQLVEASAAVNRAMRVGPILMRHIENLLGPIPPAPDRPTEPQVEAQYRDDLARWVMQAWQLMLQDFLNPALGGHLMFDALHNDTDRGLAGDALLFFRAVAPKHGNARDVLRHTARDAMVFTVILATAELDGPDRVKQVLESARAGISERTFADMRQNVADKAALDRMVREAKRRLDKRLSQRATPMDTILISGALGDAEQMALYPERYLDLAGFKTADERIRYLFSIWSRGS